MGRLKDVARGSIQDGGLVWLGKRWGRGQGVAIAALGSGGRGAVEPEGWWLLLGDAWRPAGRGCGESGERPGEVRRRGQEVMTRATCCSSVHGINYLQLIPSASAKARWRRYQFK